MNDVHEITPRKLLRDKLLALTCDFVRILRLPLIPQLSFDRISGTKKNDILNGTSGNDDLRGDAGNDILSGCNSNDRLQGEDGNDRLFGERGDDILSGGKGKDSIWGGVELFTTASTQVLLDLAAIF